MRWFKKAFGKLFGKKDSKKEIVEENKTNDQFFYEEGEMTTYDCVVKAKELGLNMREVDDKLNSMKNKDFIKWFTDTHL
jgi:hypothetical protein